LQVRHYHAHADLLAAAESVMTTYTQGRVLKGVLGASDVWNSEIDRIQWFNQVYDTAAEEMEGAAVAQVADFFNIPMINIRVLSNNITNQGAYREDSALYCQQFVLTVALCYAGFQAHHGYTST
jgi:adenosylhomocysteine nucleosidase